MAFLRRILIDRISASTKKFLFVDPGAHSSHKNKKSSEKSFVQMKAFPQQGGFMWTSSVAFLHMGFSVEIG